MTKFSSFKKQQKLFENWRQFNEETPAVISNTGGYEERQVHDEEDAIDNTEMVEEGYAEDEEQRMASYSADTDRRQRVAQKYIKAQKLHNDYIEKNFPGAPEEFVNDMMRDFEISFNALYPVKEESYRAAYDAGHLRSDDERRSDNKNLQRAADEYADKMHDAWTAAPAGSKEEAHYEKEYRKHSENANRESPLPVHQLEEASTDEDAKGGGNVNESFEDTREMESLLGQINAKLDALEQIDSSIDYLSSLMADEDPLLTRIKQQTYGRYAKPGKFVGGGDKEAVSEDTKEK